MKLDGKKILVTGADGFIGSHLVEALISRGHDVRAFVYYNSFNSWGWLDTLPTEQLKKLDVFAGDIRDPNGVLTSMKDCDVVFHLAALIAIPFSYHSPDSYVDTNIKGTLNILQAARQCNVSRVLVTSTSEVYGTAQYVPIDEKHPYQGQSPYSATKIGADRMAESFYRSFDLPVTTVQPLTHLAQDNLHALLYLPSSHSYYPAKTRSGLAAWSLRVISTMSLTPQKDSLHWPNQTARSAKR